MIDVMGLCTRKHVVERNENAKQSGSLYQGLGLPNLEKVAVFVSGQFFLPMQSFRGARHLAKHVSLPIYRPCSHYRVSHILQAYCQRLRALDESVPSLSLPDVRRQWRQGLNTLLYLYDQLSCVLGCC